MNKDDDPGRRQYGQDLLEEGDSYRRVSAGTRRLDGNYRHGSGNFRKKARERGLPGAGGKLKPPDGQGILSLIRVGAMATEVRERLWYRFKFEPDSSVRDERMRSIRIDHMFHKERS